MINHCNKKDKKLSEIIRVNHAGELCAKFIYLGQLSVINDKNIEEMLDQELKHLNYFEKKAAKSKVRLSILTPLCVLGGFLAGAGSALAGRNYAMSLTESVEDVIEKHYEDQIEYLDNNDNHIQDDDLKEHIKQFYEDEKEHKHIASQEGASLASKSFSKCVSFITKTVIKIAKKI